MSWPVPNEHGVYGRDEPAAILSRPKLDAAVYVLEIHPGTWAHTGAYAFHCGSCLSASGPLMANRVKPTREGAVEWELRRILQAADECLSVKLRSKPGEDKVGYAWEHGNKTMKVEAAFLKGWAEQELESLRAPTQMALAL